MSDDQLMVLGIQGCRLKTFDPKIDIASQFHNEEILFCAGSMIEMIVSNFMKS